MNSILASTANGVYLLGGMQISLAALKEAFGGMFENQTVPYAVRTKPE